MENKRTEHPEIKGWRVDADPQDEPNYPIKKYTGDDHKRINWARPSLQKNSVEILKSTERPYLTAVFGTPNPPRGLSGVLRRLAFKWSENMIKHWLILLIADRIDVVEGIFSDIFHGRWPRLMAERGWGAIAKYRPWLLVRKIVVRLLVLGIVAGLIAYFIYKDK